LEFGNVKLMTLPPNDLPPEAFAGFDALSDEQRAAFANRYNSAKRSMALMMALAIIFPIQLFFLGKVLLGILFLITGGGFGVWYVVEWFLTPGRVREYNAKMAGDILAGMGAGTIARSTEDE
jgi:hypothetical protein